MSATRGLEAGSPLGLLEGVSRSFYLTLRLLPRSIRSQIGLAYLLARTSDTIADSQLVPLAQRLESLELFRERILGSINTRLEFNQLASQQSSPAERVLLEECECSVALLEEFSGADQQRVREVLQIIISGQELDVRRFAGATGDHVIALRTEAELDDYTYRVAGCVGEFWTRICRAHLFPKANLDQTFLLTQGVRFGKGLQLVNILRDLATDLRQGRCYIPEQSLASASLTPADLLDKSKEMRLRPVYNRLLDSANEHLLAGWAYTNALPFRCARVRMACALPILLGLRTIAALSHAKVLDPAVPVKVGRAEVRKLFRQVVVYYPVPSLWRGLGKKAQTQASGN